jgi:hypothetical protein
MLYLAVIVAALVITVYLTLQVVGFLVKLLFLAAVTVLALAAFRAWRGAS